MSYSPDADRLRWGDRSSEHTEAAGSTESDELANATPSPPREDPARALASFAAPSKHRLDVILWLGVSVPPPARGALRSRRESEFQRVSQGGGVTCVTRAGHHCRNSLGCLDSVRAATPPCEFRAEVQCPSAPTRTLSLVQEGRTGAICPAEVSAGTLEIHSHMATPTAHVRASGLEQIPPRSALGGRSVIPSLPMSQVTNQSFSSA